MNDLETIQKKIYEIRGQRVMLDRDLAELYGVTTGALNQAVKRNKERFPEDFMFQLTRIEFDFIKSIFQKSKSADIQKDDVLISQFVISKPIERRGGSQKLPYAWLDAFVYSYPRHVAGIVYTGNQRDISKLMVLQGL